LKSVADAIDPNAKGRHFRYVVAIATGDLGELLRLSMPFSEIVVFNPMVAAGYGQERCTRARCRGKHRCAGPGHALSAPAARPPMASRLSRATRVQAADADRATPWHCVRSPPASGEGQGSARPHRDACRGRPGRHRIGSRESDRSIELIVTISTELRGGGAGAIIMVATGRKEGNDKPSIVSSSVITSYEPACNSRSILAIRTGCLKTNVSRRDRVIIMIIVARWRRRAGTSDSSWRIEAMSRALNAQ